MVQYDVATSPLKLRDNPIYTLTSLNGKSNIGTPIIVHDGMTEVTFNNSGNQIMQDVLITFSIEQITN